ncbi:BnaC02g29790D [Brassica napus]|uniref:BnaC02g29790D protein n=1 Tax=Brassica napus TaxID=3708 RepID=A0A078FJ32_BRANA|nr:BnaC02g29790D [Brassica napus]
MEVRPVGKSDNERLRVRLRLGGLVYHIHGHSGDMIRIRILGVDLISILEIHGIH